MTLSLEIGFYVIPANIERRQRWITAISRDDWQPKKSDRICGQHFVHGKPSKNPEDVDYVPTIFKDRKRRVNVVKFNEDREERQAKRALVRQELAQKRDELEEIEGAAEALLTFSFSQPSSYFTETEFKEASVQTDLSLLLPSETSLLLISNQQLQLKVAALEQEIFGFTSKRPMFGSIIDNDERTKFYTGLPSYNLFSALLEYIQPKVATRDTSESGIQVSPLRTRNDVLRRIRANVL